MVIIFYQKKNIIIIINKILLYNTNMSEDANPKKWYLLKCIGGNEENVIKKLRNHSEFEKFFVDNFIILAEYEKGDDKDNKKKGPAIFGGYFLGQMDNSHLGKAILRTCGASIVKEYKPEDIDLLLENIKYQTNLSVNKNFTRTWNDANFSPWGLSCDCIQDSSTYILGGGAVNSVYQIIYSQTSQPSLTSLNSLNSFPYFRKKIQLEHHLSFIGK
jgi:hypothetical protein